MLVPFGEWLPDQPDFQNPGSATITNVYPRTAQSYGPVGGLSNILSALTARCQGASGFRDSAGNGYVFAGDASKLYLASSSSASFSDISKVGGYSAASDESWRFAQFGDRILAHQINDAIQSYVIGSSAVTADLAAAAPKARYSAVVKDFLIVGNTVDATYGTNPQRIWWPAINDPTNWPTPGTSAAAAVQSDFQDVVGDHGWLMGLIANVGPADALLLFERAVFRLMYIGAPDIFGIYPMHGVRGCASPGSVALTEFGVIYLGPDDFYLNDGNQAVPMGFQKVAKTIYSDIQQNLMHRITATVDPINKLYVIAYPSNSSSGNPDTILFCNYALKSAIGSPGKWSKVTGLSVEQLLRSVSFGYTVDTIDAATGYNTDTAPFGPDSRVWTGGAKEILAAFDSTHTMSYFNGSNLAPTVETTETQILPGKRADVTQARPITDGGDPTVTPYVRNRIQNTATATTSSAVNSNGDCFFADACGFYHRFRMTMSAGQTWSHIEGIDIPEDAVTDDGVV